METRSSGVAKGGGGTIDLGTDVSAGRNVTMDPLLRPIASCFPFGDHDTVYVNT
jgi:hypothetical protein